MLDYTCVGKSGTARILVEILNFANRPKLQRKVTSFLQDNFEKINKILEISDIPTRLQVLQLYNEYFNRVTRRNLDIKLDSARNPLPPYTDPLGRTFDTEREIRLRMFALVSEKIRDGLHDAKTLLKNGYNQIFNLYVKNPWHPMGTVPRDGTPVLLFTDGYGIVEAWFAKGEWDNNHEWPEYNGPAWVCADDRFQIEVEEHIDEETGRLQYYDGGAKAWMPKPTNPITGKDE
jgi:hypothetical protein